jgi:bleomycin hydrolase
MKSFIHFVISMAIILISGFPLLAQDTDQGKFEKSKPGFYDEIKKSIKEFNTDEKPEKLNFAMDYSGKNLPKSLSEFTYYWHTPPLSQGRTGSCWCFSTISFFESEVKRIHDRELKLSEMYTVYWEYVEKASRYVKMRGNSYFAEGSEANAVTRIWEKYGVVPANAYSGMLQDQKFHDHKALFNEMNTYLTKAKEINIWNESEILANIKSILNYYLGEPPLKVMYEEESLTALEYMEKAVALDLDEYVDVLSLLQQPYYQQVEYPVEDNWWINSDYYNVKLDEFMGVLKKAIRAGYTMSIGGDTSEPGYDSHSEVAMVPTFDIPAEYIDEYARQMRFSNKTTTDDHGIHLIGYVEKDGQDWYVIKDSGAGGFTGPNKGYRFYHEDYVKLKMMDFMVHKDALGGLITKFERENDE